MPGYRVLIDQNRLSLVSPLGLIRNCYCVGITLYNKLKSEGVWLAHKCEFCWPEVLCVLNTCNSVLHSDARERVF